VDRRSVAVSRFSQPMTYTSNDMVQTTFERESRSISRETAFILWMEEIALDDIPFVGYRNAVLGETSHHLKANEVNFPIGFVITAYAYQYFIDQSGLNTQLHQLLTNLDRETLRNLSQISEQAHSVILNSSVPQGLADAIATAYTQLCERHYNDVSLNMGQHLSHKAHHDEIMVTVRFNSIEEFPSDDIAKEKEKALNICGIENILKAFTDGYANLFTEQAISERILKGTGHADISLAVNIQQTINSELAPSGNIFSIDPATGFENAILITVAKDYQENIKPNGFFVFKPTLKEGFRSILSKRLAYELPNNVPVSQLEFCKDIISDEEIISLASLTCLIEDHYSQLRGTYTPIKINWAKDQQTEKLYVIEIYPILQSEKSNYVQHSYHLIETGNILVHGHAIGNMIGQGKVRVISDIHALPEFQQGEVLVTNRTDPDWRPMMSKASAIVTNQGGRTCHSAISAREMRIPAIVGCGTATQDLYTGQEVTVFCAAGEGGIVYDGLLSFKKVQETETPLDSLPQTRTQILINVGNPEEAFRLASLPCDGVGVARSEFIIVNEVKVHPLALVHFDRLEDNATKQEVAALTHRYKHKPDYFVDKMAQGISMIAAAFYPKPVIVRTSDFKSNEYANLIGGQQFEPSEENPMIGWRGASRYYDEKYREAYHLECKALKRVRDEIGLTNVIPLIPFCRTPVEGRKVLAEMETQGLKRGVNGLQVYVMCEIPSNVLLAEKFSEIFDGFSIGSNDLTQLVLGIDRDSEMIDHLFDEQNEAVKEMIRLMIEKAKKHNRKVGICGQAPSDYPELVRFLVGLGIDSISLSPDSVIKTRQEVFEAENSDSTAPNQ
jgi:pyruvate,water dikinase